MLSCGCAPYEGEILSLEVPGLSVSPTAQPAQKMFSVGTCTEFSVCTLPHELLSMCTLAHKLVVMCTLPVTHGWL